MKTFLYLILFIMIIGIAMLGFFSLSKPNISQTITTKNLDSKAAFVAPKTEIPAQ